MATIQTSRFYFETELKEFGFKHLGDNVKIARTCIIPDPSTVSIGSHTKIDDFTIITGTVSIGNYCHIGHRVHLSGHAGLDILDHCSFSSGCTVYTESDNFDGDSLVGPQYPDEYRNCFRNHIIINKYCNIGANCIVFPGSELNPTYLPEGGFYHRGSLIVGRYNSWSVFGSSSPNSRAQFIKERKDGMIELAKRLERQHGGLFITAELSTNWEGDFDVLYNLMAGCKQAGFDAVKLQAFRKDDLRSGRHERLRSAVTRDNIKRINNIAKEVGIEWYCMSTYPEAVDFIDPYVNIWKIRLKDSDDVQLCNKVLSTGKKVIISCKYPKHYDTGRIKTLYCKGDYPTKIIDVNYNDMKKFDGFSCHTPELSVLQLAVRLGVNYIEMHVTPDKNKDLIDNKVSFDIANCRKIIDLLRAEENVRRNNNPSTVNLKEIS